MKIETKTATRIDARGLHFRELNQRIRQAVESGARVIELDNVHGQRFIGTNVGSEIEIRIHGTPGNDLGAFLDGPRIVVHGNAQDGCGNTMNSGEIVVHGRAGDVAALSARGGRLFVRDEVGYRAGIHMKQYQGSGPLVVIGGTAQDFLGEYMAGGTLIVLGRELSEGERHHARFIGTGMHGGTIYVRGLVDEEQLSGDVVAGELDDSDWVRVEEALGAFESHFGIAMRSLMEGRFVKLTPRSLRPYGKLYAD